MNVNLMSANITAGAATSAADLLTDLKSGYLLGANPRKQFLAQFAGIFAGTVVTVLCFQVMVPDASVLGTTQFPAPAAQTWRAVAESLSKGIESLGPGEDLVDRRSAALVGIILPLLAKCFPSTRNGFPRPPASAWPGPSTGTTACCSSSARSSATASRRRRPRSPRSTLFPVASGIIAGGSLMAVLLIFCETARDIDN